MDFPDYLSQRWQDGGSDNTSTTIAMAAKSQTKWAIGCRAMERRTRGDTQEATSRTAAEMGMTITSARIRIEIIVPIGSDTLNPHWIRNVTLTEADTLIWPTDSVSPVASDGPPAF